MPSRCNAAELQKSEFHLLLQKPSKYTTHNVSFCNSGGGEIQITEIFSNYLFLLHHKRKRLKVIYLVEKFYMFNLPFLNFSYIYISGLGDQPTNAELRFLKHTGLQNKSCFSV